MIRAAPLGYRAAIHWLVENDDTDWVGDENGSNSVTASLIADIYDRTDAEVKRDLVKALTAGSKKESAR